MQAQESYRAQRLRAWAPAPADAARREYRAHRTPSPHKPALARQQNNGACSRVPLSTILGLEHRNKPRFQLFFRCKEKPIFANSGVFARDKPSKPSDRQIMANPRGRLVLAVYRQCGAFAACDPCLTGAHRRVAGRQPRRKDQHRRLRRSSLGGGVMGDAAWRHRQEQSRPQAPQPPDARYAHPDQHGSHESEQVGGQCLQLGER